MNVKGVFIEWLEDFGNMEIIHYKVGSSTLIDSKSCACIGYFDGLHIGHQELIKKVLEICGDDEVPTLITFEPDPWLVLRKLDNIPQLLPMEKRIEIGKQLGIQRWILLHFDQTLASLSPQEFIRVLEQLKVSKLVCGFDFHFGSKGQGNVSVLKESAAFEVYEIAKVQFEEHKVSTTYIEHLLEQGNVRLANQLMNRHYAFEGFVIAGMQKGRTINFPTANLQLCDNYLIPKTGAYMVHVYLHDHLYFGIMNIGHNPTFNYRDSMSIEVHLFDFDEMIYGEKLRVEMIERIRDEQKFNNINELINRLELDMKLTKEYFTL